MASQQDLADMERMSADYVPEIKGPLVGGQQSTRALVAEYAEADPIYIHKTTALPSKYSHYRTLRGDGNCGWRALAFGYFEALLRIGDKDKVLMELAKLKVYNKRLDATGFEPDIYEGFEEHTFELLEQTAEILPNHDDGASILTAFNDFNISSGITYHFRLITSAWMKSHPDFYADFLPDIDVHTYCRDNIEPFSVELDNVGLQALATALINEAGVAIEVLYLDRSAGGEVTPHKWPVVDAEGRVVESASTIRLLYRPGHYDLVYKAEDIARMSTHALSNPEIRLASPQPTFYGSSNPAYSYSTDLDALFDMPGFTMSGRPAFSKLPYHPQCEPSPPRKTLSPIKKEEPSPPRLSPASHANSASSTERAIETKPLKAKFRKTYTQFEFDFDQLNASNNAEPELASFIREESPDTSKREDPAHYSHQAFQPQIWRPGRDYERSSES